MHRLGAKELGVWAIGLPAAAALATAAAVMAYYTSPPAVLVASIGAVLAAVVVYRPLFGVYAALLLVPYELVAVKIGRSGALSPAEAILLLTALSAGIRIPFSRFDTRIHPVYLAFVGVLAIVTVGLAFVDDMLVPAKILLMWTAFLLVMGVVAGVSAAEAKRVMGCLALAGGLVGLVALINTGDQQLVRGGAEVINRAEGSFSDPNVLGFFLILAIPSGFILAAGSALPIVRLTMLASAILGLGGLALSLSRGGVAGFAASLCVMLGWPDFRRLAAALLVLLAAFVSLNFAALAESERIAVVQTRLGTITQAQKLQADPRAEIWRAAPEVIADHRFVGTGAGLFSSAAPPAVPRYNHAHNTFLTVAAELGLLGLTFFVAFMVAVAQSAYRALRYAPPAWRPAVTASIAALVGLLVAGLADYPFRTNLIMAPAMIYAAIFIAAERSSGEPQRGLVR